MTLDSNLLSSRTSKWSSGHVTIKDSGFSTKIKIKESRISGAYSHVDASYLLPFLLSNLFCRKILTFLFYHSLISKVMPQLLQIQN